MAIAEVFPYSNQHDLNLDWVISKIKEFSGNQISGISCEQISEDTVKFVITYTDGTTRELTDVILPEGPQGPQGETGATPNLTAGTITTLPAGSDATVSITGTAEDPVLNLGIPQGIQGETGATGAPGGITNFDGYTGALTAGDGIAFDTSTGEISSYDFNLTDTSSISVNAMILPANVSSGYGSIFKALNADKTIGKVYGYAVLTLSTVTGNTPTALDTGFIVSPPDTAYNINVGTLARKNDGSPAVGTFLRVDTTGKVYLYFTQTSTISGTIIFEFPASIYFFKDFGDTPDANTLSMRMAALSLDPIEAQER